MPHRLPAWQSPPSPPHIQPLLCAAPQPPQPHHPLTTTSCALSRSLFKCAQQQFNCQPVYLPPPAPTRLTGDMPTLKILLDAFKMPPLSLTSFFLTCALLSAAAAAPPSPSSISIAFVYADFVEAAGAAAPFWHDWGFQKAMTLLSRAFDVTWFNVADAGRLQMLQGRLGSERRPDVVWSKGCWNGHAHQFMLQARAAGLITPRTPTVIFPACSR